MIRRFVLRRHVDETGISGAGDVAEGVAFSDGVVALRWIVPPGNPGHGWPTSVVFHDNGVASVEAIHGHGGKTEMVWLDDAPCPHRTLIGPGDAQVLRCVTCGAEVRA